MAGDTGGPGIALAGQGRRRLAFVAAALTAAMFAAPAQAVAAPKRIRLGTQKLTRCATAPLAYCGSFPAPLDHASPGGPYIAISYRWFPADRSPGVGSQGNGRTGRGRPRLPLDGVGRIRRRGHSRGLPDDVRGAARTAQPACHRQPRHRKLRGPELPEPPGVLGPDRHRGLPADGGGLRRSAQPPLALPRRGMGPCLGPVQLCARRRGHGRNHRCPGAVLKIDLYGDSYGSFFAQVFAARYPQPVRSVTLDSTYKSVGLDPWYRSSRESMPAAFDAACARATACAQAEPGSAWARIEALAARLREAPVSGRVPGPGARGNRSRWASSASSIS